jgi:hypothetical protein
MTTLIIVAILSAMFGGTLGALLMACLVMASASDKRWSE